MGAPIGNKNAAGHHSKKYLDLKLGAIERQKNKLKMTIRKISSMNWAFGSKTHVAMMRAKGYYKKV